MTRTFLIGLTWFALLAAGSAEAAQAQVPSPQVKPQLYVITESDCRLLTRHTAREDVSFKPGIGAGGKPVTPADLPTDYGQFELPEEVTFDLLVRLRDDDLLAPEGSVGTVSVDLTTGLVRLNDRPTAESERQALVAFCRSL